MFAMLVNEYKLEFLCQKSSKDGKFGQCLYMWPVGSPLLWAEPMGRTDFTASLKIARWHGTSELYRVHCMGLTWRRLTMTQPTFFAARTLPVSRLGCFRLFRMLSIAYGKKFATTTLKQTRAEILSRVISCMNLEQFEEVKIRTF